MEKIHEAAKQIPVFLSFNMSLGVNILLKLVKEAAKNLANFDIEIIEKHHNKKVDSPSGTAVMIANAVTNRVSFCSLVIKLLQLQQRRSTKGFSSYVSNSSMPRCRILQDDHDHEGHQVQSRRPSQRLHRPKLQPT